jgi:hypothetical protein
MPNTVHGYYVHGYYFLVDVTARPVQTQDPTTRCGPRGTRRALRQIGGQALRLGLIDQVVVNVVRVVFGSGRPFFATGALADPILLDDPSQIIRGDRVTHLVYDVAKS